MIREPRLFQAQRVRVIDLEIGNAWEALPRGSCIEPCAEDDDLLKAASEMLVQPVVEVRVLSLTLVAAAGNPSEIASAARFVLSSRKIGTIGSR
jgi:hypothetical protein